MPVNNVPTNRELRLRPSIQLHCSAFCLTSKRRGRQPQCQFGSTIAYASAIALTLFLIFANSTATAQHESQTMQSIGSWDAHEHGRAELLIVLEGEELDIELQSPAMNVLGFEQRANNPEQQAKLEQTREILADANDLFQLDSLRCQLTHHSVDLSRVTQEKNQHTREHSDELPVDHHHKEGNNAHGHSDVEAYYRYRCEGTDQPGSLSTKIPARFPGIQALRVQWIVNGRQGSTTLDNEERTVLFQ